jgi:uncharacterized cupredoxin-like copper-binding protein
MSKRNMGLMALILAGGVGLAACSSSQPTTDNSNAATVPTAASETNTNGAAPAGAPVVLPETKTLDTFVYEPNAWTTNVGADTSITLDNTAGTQEHTWVLLKKDVTRDQAIAIAQGDETMVIYETKAAAGQKGTGKFTAPTVAGDYLVICHVPGHAAGGMVGTLTVK